MVDKKKRHESGTSTASEDADYVVTPPDGGWGWVVCFACVLCNFIVDGIAYCFGVFLPEFTDYFNSSKGKTSLVGSLLCGVYLSTGPIAGALVNRFGCRPVTVVGAFVSGTALFLSTFSTSIDGLIVLYGVLGGFGVGLVYVPAVVAVGYYFEKKRALATGLAVAGSGLGTIAFPPLCRYLLEQLDWKYAVTILACLLLNCAILGMFMRPLEAKKVKSKPRKKTFVDRIRRRKRKESEPLDIQFAIDKTQEARQNRLKGLEDSGSESGSIHYSTRNSVQRHNSRVSAHSQNSPTTPITPVPTIVIDSPDGNEVTELQPLKNGTEANGNSKSDYYKSESNVTNLKRKHYTDPESQNKGIHHSMSDMLRHRAQEIFKPPNEEIKKEDFGRPMYRKDIFYSGSVANFHAFRSQPDVTSYVQSITAIPRNLPGEHQSSCPIWLCPCLGKSARDTLATMLDFSLLKNPSFLVIALANVFGTFALFIPFVYLADRAILLGVGRVEAAFLVSIIGISNTLGRVIWGGLSDLPQIKAIWVNNFTLYATALTVCLCPFCDTYVTMIVFAVFFGLFVAGFIALTSVIICDLCGLQNLTTGFGLLTLFRGVTGMIGSPVAGMLYDALGSYDIPFFLAGGCFLACALIHSILFLPYFANQTSPQDIVDGECDELRDELNEEEGSSSDTSDGEEGKDDNDKPEEV